MTSDTYPVVILEGEVVPLGIWNIKSIQTPIKKVAQGINLIPTVPILY